MNRRNFLGKRYRSAAATLLARNLSWAADQHRIENIGIQLYTVRDALAAGSGRHAGQSRRHRLSRSRRTVAQSIAARRPKPRSPATAWSVLPFTATTINSATNGPKVLDFCNAIGAKYAVISWIEDSVRNAPDGFKRAAEDFNRAGEMSKKAGIQFAFHNHWIDFTPTPKRQT